MIIEGEGVLREKLETLIHQAQLEETVELWGNIKPDILPLLYGAVDVVIFPTTHQEGFGLEALAALSCGRPVLTTKIGALMEILEGIQIQWLVPDRDNRSLEKLMIAYLKDQITVFQPERIRNILIEQGYSRSSGLQQLKKVFVRDFKQDILPKDRAIVSDLD